jgi:uncharacterized delta-60 repeat protein
MEARALLSLAGGPDLAFGTNGYADASGILKGPFNTPVDFTSVASVLQPDGDLIVAGTESGSLPGGPSPTGYESLGVVRYTANGQVDSSFKSTMILNVTVGLFYPGSWSMATGVALQSDKIILVGENDNEAKVIRLDSDGSLDTTFGTGGIVTLGTLDAGDSMLDYASAVTVLPSGQIAVAGAVEPTTVGQDTPAIEMLNADGTVDTSYGNNGLAVVPLPSNAQSFAPIAANLHYISYTSGGPLSLAQEPDGELAIQANAILAADPSTDEIVDTLLTTSGTPDTTFGTGGQATITQQSVFPTADLISGTALAVQPNGDLVVGGAIFIPGSPSRMMVARLGTAGSLDTTFGVGGVNILPLATPVGASVGAIAVQADDQIVLADSVTHDFARLNLDGFLDFSFGTAGQSVIPDTPTALQAGPIDVSQTGDGTVGLTITAGGQILATQKDEVAGTYELLGQGATGDYNGDGISDLAVYDTTTGTFIDKTSAGAGAVSMQFGPVGLGQSLPAPGAYGGEGIDELGVYVPSVGEFAIHSLESGQTVLAPFGPAGYGQSLPAPGDYDKSGATELAVYVPSTGIYAYRPADGGPDVYVAIGTPGSGAIPVPADYFGTGQDDVAVYEPATATFLIQDPNSSRVYSIQFGIPGAGNSIPVPGDYIGSGHAELAVYIPGLAELVYGPGGDGPSQVESFGLPGAGQTLPAPGDYDGMGRTDVAAYFPSSGIFAYRSAEGGSDSYASIGTPNQTIPYTLASATDASGPGVSAASASAGSASATAEIPLTPDVLDTLVGKKKAGTA